MPCTKLARCPSLPIRGSVVAYPQVARTGEHLAWLLPGQVTLWSGTVGLLGLLLAASEECEWRADPRGTTVPLGQTPRSQLQVRHPGCRFCQPSREIEPAEPRNRTRQPHAQQQLWWWRDKNLERRAFPELWLRFRICCRDVSRRPSGSRQQALWTCDTCVQTETLQCSRFCPC